MLASGSLVQTVFVTIIFFLYQRLNDQCIQMIDLTLGKGLKLDLAPAVHSNKNLFCFTCRSSWYRFIRMKAIFYS